MVPEFIRVKGWGTICDEHSISLVADAHFCLTCCHSLVLCTAHADKEGVGCAM